MSNLQFEEEERVMRPSQIRKSGRVTKWFLNHSFGLIKTEQQAAIVQILIILISIGYIFFMMSDSSESTIQMPSEELINSPQPINQPRR